MKKVLENMKKNQRGAVSTLVLFTLLMFVVILMGTYVLVSANARSQLQSDERIQEIIRKRPRQIRRDIYRRNRTF